VDVSSALKPDSAGFLYVDRGRFRALFCTDLPEKDAKVAAATQKRPLRRNGDSEGRPLIGFAKEKVD